MKKIIADGLIKDKTHLQSKKTGSTRGDIGTAITQTFQTFFKSKFKKEKKKFHKNINKNGIWFRVALMYVD